MSLNPTTTDDQDEVDELNMNHVTVDQAFERCGGFGLFQFMSAFFNTIANAAAMFFFNAFAFLELEPQFKCQLTPGELTYSTPTDNLEEQFCNSPELCEIDWDSNLTINNLII